MSELRALRLEVLSRYALVSLGRDPQGRPLEAIVLRAGTELRAYTNRCKHLPIPLDAGSGDILAPDGVHLLCGTHGALYRPGDGLCVLGPCKGAALDPLSLRVDDEGWIWITRP